VDLRTQFGLHRRVTLEQPVSLCEPVYKAHEEEALPEESPPMLPLTCYKMTGENAQAQVQLADHNGFYDGQAVVGQPQIFCDPAEKKVRRQE
ncbi:MAG: hypothetical protein GTN78_05590, partial [Gemmatimonadales bacterium]|nr:hypothetical protein [Gemmatimonadales bacterium]